MILGEKQGQYDQLKYFSLLLPLNVLSQVIYFRLLLELFLVFLFSFHFCIVCFSVHGSIVTIGFSLQVDEGKIHLPSERKPHE